MIHFTPDDFAHKWLIGANYCSTAFGNYVWQPMVNGESSGIFVFANMFSYARWRRNDTLYLVAIFFVFTVFTYIFLLV